MKFDRVVNHILNEQDYYQNIGTNIIPSQAKEATISPEKIKLYANTNFKEWLYKTTHTAADIIGWIDQTGTMDAAHAIWYLVIERKPLEAIISILAAIPGNMFDSLKFAPMDIIINKLLDVIPNSRVMLANFLVSPITILIKKNEEAYNKILSLLNIDPNMKVANTPSKIANMLIDYFENWLKSAQQNEQPKIQPIKHLSKKDGKDQYNNLINSISAQYKI